MKCKYKYHSLHRLYSTGMGMCFSEGKHGNCRGWVYSVGVFAVYEFCLKNIFRTETKITTKSSKAVWLINLKLIQLMLMMGIVYFL